MNWSIDWINGSWQKYWNKIIRRIKKSVYLWFYKLKIPWQLKDS